MNGLQSAAKMSMQSIKLYGRLYFIKIIEIARTISRAEESATENWSAGNVACPCGYWTKRERNRPSGRGAVFFCVTRYNCWGLVTFAEARTAVKYHERVSPRCLLGAITRRLPQSDRLACSASKRRKGWRRRRWKIGDRKQRQRSTSETLLKQFTRQNGLNRGTWAAELVQLQSTCGDEHDFQYTFNKFRGRNAGEIIINLWQYL